jgi:hypothetical protein
VFRNRFIHRIWYHYTFRFSVIEKVHCRDLNSKGQRRFFKEYMTFRTICIDDRLSPLDRTCTLDNWTQWRLLSEINNMAMKSFSLTQPVRLAPKFMDSSIWWNSHRKISSGWYWYKNSGYIGQISFWISVFDSWNTARCSFNNVTAFTWLYWFQIVPFALSATSVDTWFRRKTDGICASYAAGLACYRTRWLGSGVITKPRFDLQNENSCLRSCGTRAASMLLTSS